MQSLFLFVAGKNSLLSKIKRVVNCDENKYSQIFSYLTFLNFGDLKNITLKLKNNIKIVSVGTIYSIESELNKEGILAKIKCM